MFLSDSVRYPLVGGSRLIRNRLSDSWNSEGVEKGVTVVQRLDRGRLGMGISSSREMQRHRRCSLAPEKTAGHIATIPGVNQLVSAASAANQ
jgi:hypothetical protein